MIQLQSEIEIDAPDHVVWAVLTDFKTYPEWTGWKGSISGAVKPGALLKVVARPRPGKVQVTFFRVIRVNENRELRWVAIYIPFGLLRGERYWVLGKLGSSRTKLIRARPSSVRWPAWSAAGLKRRAPESTRRCANG